MLILSMVIGRPNPQQIFNCKDDDRNRVKITEEFFVWVVDGRNRFEDYSCNIQHNKRDQKYIDNLIPIGKSFIGVKQFIDFFFDFTIQAGWFIPSC